MADATRDLELLRAAVAASGDRSRSHVQAAHRDRASRDWHSRARISIGGVRSAFDEAAEDWVGFSSPPPERVIAQSAWRVNDEGTYCPRCGDTVGSGEYIAGRGCRTCRPGAELSGGIADRVVRLGIYACDFVDWIRAIKYDRWQDMGEALGTRLGVRLRELLVALPVPKQGVGAHSPEPRPVVVVPMPMPLVRRWFRGIDHTRVIAEAAASAMKADRRLRVRLASPLVRRHTAPQVALTPSDRRLTSGKSMRLRRRIPLLMRTDFTGCTIVIIDDIRTTGATMKAASRLMRSTGAVEVWGGVLAVSDSTARRVRSGEMAFLEQGEERPQVLLGEVL